jgi:hypothetical protein
MGDLPILTGEPWGVTIAGLTNPQSLASQTNGKAVLENRISGHLAALRWL